MELELKLGIIISINLLLLVNSNRIFKLVKIYDYPDNKRKIHQNPISLFGGIFFLINLIFINFFFPFNNFVRAESLIIIFYSIIFFLIGYFDDKFNIKPSIRTLLNIVFFYSFLILYDQYILYELKFISLDKNIYLENFGIIFTIFCYLSFSNALNMYDGIDGQSGIYIIFLFLIFLYLSKDNYFLLFLIPLFSFLILNFRKLCFQGNSGINMISFFISIIVIKFYKEKYITNVEDILFFMFLPGMEMFRLFFFRIINKKNPFKADKLHIHHLLLKHFNSTQVILITSSMAIFPYFTYIYLNKNSWVFIFFLSVYSLLITVSLKKS